MLDLCTEYAVLLLLNERCNEIHRAVKAPWRSQIPPPAPADNHADYVVQRGGKHYRLTVRSVFKPYSEGAYVCRSEKISKLQFQKFKEDQKRLDTPEFVAKWKQRKKEYTLLLAKEKKLWDKLKKLRPKCPDCNITMVLRYRTPRPAFWGCRQFPTCRGLKEIRASIWNECKRCLDELDTLNALGFKIGIGTQPLTDLDNVDPELTVRYSDVG